MSRSTSVPLFVPVGFCGSWLSVPSPPFVMLLSIPYFHPKVKWKIRFIADFWSNSEKILQNPRFFNGCRQLSSENSLFLALSEIGGTLCKETAVHMGTTVWEFEIGAYQVCEKWLRERRRQRLTAAEIVRYQQVLSAVGETLRLMGQIAAVGGI